MLHVKNRRDYGVGRLTPLEAYRGIAAIIVLVHHFFLGFAPEITGVLPGTRNQDSVVGSYYFFMFNGIAAVHFFFVLSGFVLCWSYFNAENSEKLYQAMLKRYPRLAGVVLVTTLTSFSLFWLGLYFFKEAAQISNSDWLLKFGYGIDPKSFNPSLWGAVIQGLTTFFTGIASYNSNLWTMKHEFYGSLLVYMAALFVSVALKYRKLLYFFGLFSFSVIFYNPLMLPFVVGLYLSIYIAKNNPCTGFFVSWMLICAGLYALGYVVPERSYVWVNRLPDRLMPNIQLLMHTAGALMIIYATMTNEKIFDSLNGPVFRYLGKLSFPIYLVHLLVIASASAYAYVLLSRYGMDKDIIIALTFFVTLVVSLIFSIPLSKLDDWWVNLLNGQTKKL